jgi:2-dehydro-3-deoxygluconokinase
VKTVVGFGEVMVRISATGPAAFGDSNVVQMHAGGSEANVLAKVGGLTAGIKTHLVTAFRDDLAGRAMAADLQKSGVGLQAVRWTRTDRNGVYYVEQGMGPIVARVDYDRVDSAIARLEPDPALFDVLEDASAYFVSGITPALSDGARENTLLSLHRARDAAVPVFCDVNYRKKLWSPEAAAKTLGRMLDDGLITCLITTETDARTVFGIDRGVDDASPISTLIERGQEVLAALAERFGQGCKLFVLTVRKRITNETGQWTAVARLPDGATCVGEVFDYVVLDRPGAGDSLSAGLIGGYLGVTRDGTLDDTGDLPTRIQTGLDLGNRMAVVAQKTVGDLGPVWPATMYFNRVSGSKEIAR